jgi:hypothetical protein
MKVIVIKKADSVKTPKFGCPWLIDEIIAWGEKK